ncbi:MAG: peptidylprolyl isomerase [Gemmatimonadota bacterium]|nr:MAG: peptidylprolyl isomerase [Gemmatimonadota bacterium]
MAQARKGDTVRVHYTGSLDDRSVFDSSRERQPLEFTIGSGEVIPGFESAVIGLAPGESTRARIGADDAYGARQEGLVTSVDRSHFPDHLDLQVGAQLKVQDQAGEGLVVTIAEVDEETVTLDANHPLSGEDLTFEIELVEIL